MPAFGLKTVLLLGVVGVLSAYLLDGNIPHAECVDKVTNDGCSKVNCTTFIDTAREYCPLTCGYCSSSMTPPPVVTNSSTKGKCVDDPSTNCSEVVAGRLCTLPTFLSITALRCPVTCGFCTECIDTDERCPMLLKFCSVNEEVVKNCSLTCKTCSHDYDPQALLAPKTTLPTSSTPTVVTSPFHTEVTTTPQPTTTTPTTTTTTLPSLHSRSCDKFGVIFDVARGNLVSSPDTRTCPDGIHQPPEAVIQHHCRSPTIDKWSRGENVLANCDRIPSYSVVAGRQSDFGGTTVSGVLIKCVASGFQAAIQTCDTPLTIVTVNLTSSGGIPSADKFYVIDWN